jgi:hypothetical protein
MELVDRRGNIAEFCFLPKPEFGHNWRLEQVDEITPEFARRDELDNAGACGGVGFGRPPVDGDVGIAFVAFLERHLRFQYCRLRTGGGGRLPTDKIGKFATVCECEFADPRKRTCPGPPAAIAGQWLVSTVGSAASGAAAGALTSGAAAVVLWASHVEGQTSAASARMPGDDVHVLITSAIFCAAPCSRQVFYEALALLRLREPKQTHPTTSQVFGTGDGLAVSGRQPRAHVGPGFLWL